MAAQYSLGDKVTFDVSVISPVYSRQIGQDVVEGEVTKVHETEDPITEEIKWTYCVKPTNFGSFVANDIPERRLEPVT